MALKAQGARASASSAEPAHPADHAIDGSPATGWRPRGSSEDEWLEVILPRAFRVEYVRLSGDLSSPGVRGRLQYEADGKWVDAARLEKAATVEVKKTTGRLRILLSLPEKEDVRDKAARRLLLAEFEVWAVVP